MIIQKSGVNLSGKSFSISEKHTDEKLRAWTDSKKQEIELENKNKKMALALSIDKLEISEKAKNLQTNSANNNITEIKLSDKDQQKIDLLEDFLEKLTGVKYKFFGITRITVKNDNPEIEYNKGNTNTTSSERKGWGIQYDFHEIRTESHNMEFNADGFIKTADGREINFKIDMKMSSQFVSEKRISFRAGDAAVDPLFINLNGSTPEFSNKRMDFDINNDGTLEKIPELKSQGGYLAIDANNDGKINNGSELFGPGTGDGFGELEAYDSDKNGWIDQNDPIFDRLQIWMKDEKGQDKLYAVSEKGVGAIYLGNVDTQFDIKEDIDSMIAQVKQSGIYVNENGTVGTIQHIDLTI